jgi:uncharacterized protein YecT (DUF1311 family)
MLRTAVRAMLACLLWAGAAGLAQDSQAELQQTLARADQVIAESESVTSAEDKAEWRVRLADVLRHWTSFRDARCDPALLAYEEGSNRAASGGSAGRCRLGFDAVISADLRHRYDPGDETHGRLSLDPEADARPFYPDEPDAVTCDPPPPAECDYCGVNICWERKLAEDDAELNALWREVLASLEQRVRTGAARRHWRERLRNSQRAWLLLRDDNCDLESWETPNRFAHSIYAIQRAPCLHSETHARMAWLRSRYLDRPANGPPRANAGGMIA